MGDIIAQLAGAPQAASTAQGFYGNAMDQLISAYGSPAAGIFTSEENRALQPGFKQANQGLASSLAAQGISNSGAAKYDYSNLASNQSAAEASASAPLYQGALSQYGNLASGEAGAETSAYQNAISQLYQAIESAGSDAATAFSGAPTGGGGGSPGGSSYDPYSGTPSGGGRS